MTNQQTISMNWRRMLKVCHFTNSSSDEFYITLKCVIHRDFKDLNLVSGWYNTKQYHAKALPLGILFGVFVYCMIYFLPLPSVSRQVGRQVFNQGCICNERVVMYTLLPIIYFLFSNLDIFLQQELLLLCPTYHSVSFIFPINSFLSFTKHGHKE